MKDSGIKTNKIIIEKILEAFKKSGKKMAKNKLKILLKGLGVKMAEESSLKDMDEIYHTLSVVNEFVDNNTSVFDKSEYMYFNFSFAGQMEFDNINVLEYKRQKMILNIECKRKMGDIEEVIDKSDKQAKENIEKQLNRMFNETEYSFLVLKFVGTEFKGGYFKPKNSSKITKQTKYEQIQTKIKNFKISNHNSEIIEQSWKRLSSQDLINSIKMKNYKFSKDNDDYYEKIENFINSNKKILFINGHAGSGKTFLSLRTFYNNLKSDMLVLNQKFYKTFFVEHIESRGEKIVTYGSDWLLNKGTNEMVIVDESQRLSFTTLKKIIEKSKKIILFGDEKQIFTETDENYSMFFSRLREEGFCDLMDKIYLKTSPRFPTGVYNVIEQLSSTKVKKIKKEELSNYEINLFLTPNNFLKQYRKKRSLRENTKIYTNYDASDYTIKNKKIKIGLEEFECCGTQEMFFSQRLNVEENMIGNTHHAISYDVDNAFIYIPNLKIVKWKNETWYIFKNHDLFSLDNSENEQVYLEAIKQRNQINILLTRATKSLNILIDDPDAYIHFYSKLKKVTKNWKPNMYD
ncbi:hypothetical protein EELLY_v1c01320 [Entomoplasma ellychniae]|uniref:Schlafen group 3-like DNA/RNA helicase domain-containing protein n=1 Tax=Entomoplasma ellychniae TaxID=2114 RepID=A0A8E2UCJ4_9MOLU|nr:DNA/RNA helicase domain-containing protein [Entomoplasma ellychniae]PPE04457.1 hypothetical protein EELLY_v1c01320 [Entomoplasma ellychniae]